MVSLKHRLFKDPKTETLKFVGWLIRINDDF